MPLFGTLKSRDNFKIYLSALRSLSAKHCRYRQEKVLGLSRSKCPKILNKENIFFNSKYLKEIPIKRITFINKLKSFEAFRRKIYVPVIFIV